MNCILFSVLLSKLLLSLTHPALFASIKDHSSNAVEPGMATMSHLFAATGSIVIFPFNAGVTGRMQQDTNTLNM